MTPSPVCISTTVNSTVVKLVMEMKIGMTWFDLKINISAVCCTVVLALGSELGDEGVEGWSVQKWWGLSRGGPSAEINENWV